MRVCFRADRVPACDWEGRSIHLAAAPRAIRRAALLAVLLAVGATGCAGGSRSGSDQPGIEGAPQVVVNEASEDDVAATLRTHDIDDPQGWATIVLRYRPYPPGEEGRERLRQVLVEHEADPDEIARITEALVF
jgi:hypothetical protein